MDKISPGFNFADDENFQFRGRWNLSTAKKNFSNQLFFVMKVINYTALKIIEDSIYKQKAAKKRPQTQFQKHQIQEIFDFFC